MQGKRLLPYFESQSGQAFIERIDQSKLKGMVKNQIIELMTTKPILRVDEFEREGIVYSKPLENFYRESRMSVGVLLLVPGETGMGKSSTLRALARSYIANCPPRFLIIEPQALVSGKGNGWYGNIARKLGVPPCVEPHILAEKFYDVFNNESIKSSKTFKANR